MLKILVYIGNTNHTLNEMTIYNCDKVENETSLC